MKLLGAVGDLQKGEWWASLGLLKITSQLHFRYINMDYLFFSAIRNNSIKVLNVSYNIACQWMWHLWKCMETLPHPLHLPQQDRKVMPFIPKFHLPAHVTECQWKYSFNYIKGAARMDGKAPEHAWSMLNAVASSTKEMGPGHWCDTLDDLIRDSNWKKIIDMGK